MKQLNKFESTLYILGGLLILVGAIMPFFTSVTLLSSILYLLGAILFSAMQLRTSYDGKNVIIRRLRRQQLIGAVLVVASAAMMCMSFFNIRPFEADEWKIALMIGAVFQVYTSFRLPALLEKEED